MSIDSTISEMWLPDAICDDFANNLGLIYDNSTQLYLMNSTIREQLLNSAPEFTFTVSDSGWSNQTINIVLPYAAFDLQVQYPYYNSSTSYFPIRRAANETQYVLGRTFLQEAYVIVDWERRNFTIGQSLHVDGVSNNVVSILPPGVEVSASSQTLSTGAIAGIAVGGAAVLAIAIGAIWLLWRRRKRRNAVQDGHVPESGGEKSEPAYLDQTTHEFPENAVNDRKELPSPFVRSEVELMSEDRYEAHGDGVPHQLMSNALYELPGHSVEHELHAGHKR